MRRNLVILQLLLATAMLYAQSGGAMIFTTTSFRNGGDIPKKFSCDGGDVSPAFSWSGAPQGTRSFVLIGDDPDAPGGDWTHWVVYDLPAATSGLPENLGKFDPPPTGGHQGKNDFGKVGYGGPCPPPGKPHRYSFRLYALDRECNLKSGASKKEVEQAMRQHILAQAEWMGKYGR
jgi:hypothetical protein